MIRRMAVERLVGLLGRFPSVALLGVRQSGKTTLATELDIDHPGNPIYLDLELPSDRGKLADPEVYFAANQDRLVILDEIHRVPDLFLVLRGVIDKRRRAGRRTGQFLFLGSASMELLRQSSESLAGRIAYIELLPFLLPEIADHPSALERLWVRGGLPDSFLAESDDASMEWRRAFIHTYLERDIPSLGPRIPSATLYRFWQMLAHEQGAVHNAMRVAGSLGVSGQSVARYLDIMVDLLLVRRLEPWTGKTSKRLVRAPKVYVRDSGVVHALLGLPTHDDILGHPVAGGSWEGLVIEHVLAAAPLEARASYYRTSAGAEIDLVLDLGPGGVWAIEIKRSLAPHPSKGFYYGCEDIGATRRFVVYPGDERYPISRETEAVPVSALGSLFDPPRKVRYNRS